MTDLIPQVAINADHQRLMELIAAEEAANGEVGCGRDWGSKLLVYLQTCHLNVCEDAFRDLLREHLGHRLMEPDFDGIVQSVRDFIAAIVVDAELQIPPSEIADQETVPKHVPTAQLSERFQADLGETCSDVYIEQVVHFTHQRIHRALLHPRHTWSSPIWVLTNERNLYVVQASSLEAAITLAKQQYPEETATLRVVQANNILAPNQVIKLESLL